MKGTFSVEDMGKANDIATEEYLGGCSGLNEAPPRDPGR